MEKDHELIKLYQNGNQTAYDRLVRRYLSNTVGFFYTITRDKMVAEDLAQDVFFKLFKTLKNFKFQSAFSTYLYRTNLNTVNSWFTRNKWKRFLHLDQILNQQKIDTSVEKGWIKKELWNAISNLPKKQRSVVVMRIAEELPYKEISNITGMSEGTAKVNFHHALRTLKDALNDE
ncbi:MAG: hypothetical protein CMG55_06790 [Candidatus Marinimicrobia bacterium]|nr:hypothetical protein [Candidatus Neomarinimicrobiota bacterium]|tara:strand:+ start:186 stop:710 length:525 start_codon:yes stop_codon:yes gene_type:complete